MRSEESNSNARKNRSYLQTLKYIKNTMEQIYSQIDLCVPEMCPKLIERKAISVMPGSGMDTLKDSFIRYASYSYLSQRKVRS